MTAPRWQHPKPRRKATALPIDREGPVPGFYVLKKGQETKSLGEPGQYVFAANGDHPAKGWLMLGIVSIQTPFGQGMSAGVKKSDVRKATADEIRRALRCIHPVNGVHIPNQPGRPDAKSLQRWNGIVYRQVVAVLDSLG
jgi:hypothetical protein